MVYMACLALIVTKNKELTTLNKPLSFILRLFYCDFLGEEAGSGDDVEAGGKG